MTENRALEKLLILGVVAKEWGKVEREVGNEDDGGRECQQRCNPTETLK